MRLSLGATDAAVAATSAATRVGVVFDGIRTLESSPGLPGDLEAAIGDAEPDSIDEDQRQDDHSTDEGSGSSDMLWCRGRHVPLGEQIAVPITIRLERDGIIRDRHIGISRKSESRELVVCDRHHVQLVQLDQ